ncbi:MAG: PAS domain S-box protein [Gemmatales bacterium]
MNTVLSPQQSEERHAAILEAALDAIITIDHEGNIVEFNPAAERIFGYEQSNVMGQSLASLLVPSRLSDAHQQGLSHYLASGEGKVLGKRLEMPALRADGTEIPVELSIVRIPTPGPPQFTGYLRDLTERRQVEQALRESEARYRSIFENAVEGLFQSTPEGRYLAMNPALAWIYGFTTVKEAMANFAGGADQYDADPERRPGIRPPDGTVRRMSPVSSRRSSAATARAVWIAKSARAVRDADGKLLFYEGSVEDITDRKRAEQALRVRTKQMEDAQRLAQLGSWEWDIARNLVTWSDQLYRIFGLTREMFEPTLEGYLSRVHAADRISTRELIEQALKKRMPFKFEERIIRPDGEVRVVVSLGEVVCDEQGQPIRLSGVCQDITER